VLEVPSQLVTYNIPSVLVTKDSGTRTSHFVCFIYHLVNSDYELESARVIPILPETRTQVVSNCIH
jgi:hypothetical protein